ncbi:glycosyltransferase family 2 protein [Pantoea osteomyelitidis]|uniref:Glycosyltransferase family 2 protein n=1 Tax=Pantoea osteomyelitidis TaxID=3230026 RepID=A0ABW7PUP1_9GAMM
MEPLQHVVPTLSVIMPNWNCRPWLGEALDSLLQQSSPPDEIIVIDDGSTDGSVEWLTEQAERYPQLRVLSGARGGVSAARNKGMAIAKGDFIYFMDADDFVANNLFADFRQTYAAHPSLELFCFGAKLFLDAPSEQRDYNDIHQRNITGVMSGGSETLEKLIEHQSAHRILWSSIVSRALILRAGIQFMPVQNHEDAPFMFALYLLAKQIYLTDQRYYFKRFINTSLSQITHDFSWVENYFTVRESSERFMQQQGMPVDEGLLDGYYLGLMEGCLIKIRKNRMSVPETRRLGIKSLARKMAHSNAKLMLLWYFPPLYAGLEACKKRLTRLER